jgi:hypothetical protein
MLGSTDAEEQNFGFTPGARLERVDYEHSNDIKDRKTCLS